MTSVCFLFCVEFTDIATCLSSWKWSAIRVMVCVLDSDIYRPNTLREKPYFISPGISWKAHKYQGNTNFSSTFLIKERPYFPSLKSSKLELFCNQKAWYSMLKKISSYINLLNQKKTVFPISEKFKTRPFSYSGSMVFHTKENIILPQLFESKEDRISHLQNKNFPIIWTLPFVQNWCFCNNLTFSFIETYVSFHHMKDLLNLHYKMKYKAKLRNVSLWIANGYIMIYKNVGGIRDPLKQNLARQFCRNKNKNVSILTEVHINLDQIHHTRSNWLGAILFSP